MHFYKWGRNNLAITVHVPNACTNNCAFCVNNKLYETHKPNTAQVLQSCKTLAKTEVPDVVISGGEPMQDIKFLYSVCRIFHDKNVFINTSLIKYNFGEFVTFVNETDCVKGVNISRHADDYLAETLNNIAPDESFNAIKKPIRINVVMGEDTHYVNIINRWERYSYPVAFRADFTKMHKADLHTLEDLPSVFLSMEMIGHTRCDVCNTLTFRNPANDNHNVIFHKGLQHTSIVSENGICHELNDIIVTPDGKVFTDWDCQTEMFVAAALRDLRRGVTPTVVSDGLFGDMKATEPDDEFTTTERRQIAERAHEMRLACGGWQLTDDKAYEIAEHQMREHKRAAVKKKKKNKHGKYDGVPAIVAIQAEIDENKRKAEIQEIVRNIRRAEAEEAVAYHSRNATTCGGLHNGCGRSGLGCGSRTSSRGCGVHSYFTVGGCGTGRSRCGG